MGFFLPHLTQAIEISPCQCGFRALAISEFGTTRNLYGWFANMLALAEYIKRTPFVFHDHDLTHAAGWIEDWKFGTSAVLMHDDFRTQSITEAYSDVISERDPNTEYLPERYDSGRMVEQFGILIHGKLYEPLSEKYHGISLGFSSPNRELIIHELSFGTSPQYTTLPIIPMEVTT